MRTPRSSIRIRRTRRTTRRHEESTAAPPPGDVELARALAVHQVELEMQNEQLRTTNEQLQQVNAALVIARDRFRALHDLAPTSFVTVDPLGIIVDVNRAGEALLRDRSGSLVGRRLELFVDGTARAELLGLLAAVLDAGASRAIEVALSLAGAARVDVAIEGTAVRDPLDGAPRCLLAITDVTARKHAEAERLRVRDEVLANVSHDLRGPLSAIELAADGLVGAELDPHGRKFAVLIKRATRRALRLVRDLVEIGRAGSGRLALDVAPVDARTLVEIARDEHALAAAHIGVDLATSLPAEDVQVLADRDRVAQVLSNLIGNAFVHAPGSAIEISVTPLGSEVLLAVADHGPGIPANQHEHIFDRFWQGGDHRNGSGLGLAIAREIVEAHRGTISVRSELGSGTRFEVRLPRWMGAPGDGAVRRQQELGAVGREL